MNVNILDFNTAVIAGKIATYVNDPTRTVLLSTVRAVELPSVPQVELDFLNIYFSYYIQ